MLQFVLQHMLQHVVHHAVRHVVQHVVGPMAMLLAMRFIELDDTGRGVLVDVDDEAGQFTIELWDSTVIQQPWAEVVLPEGTWLRLDGLQNKPNLNGRCGAVLSFDRSSGRYEILAQEMWYGSSRRMFGSCLSRRPRTKRRRTYQTPTMFRITGASIQIELLKYREPSQRRALCIKQWPHLI